jgi:hypothetical protein
MTVDRLRRGLAAMWTTSSDDTLIVGRLGRKTSETTYDLEVPGTPNTYYVSLGFNGDQGQPTAYDAVGVLVEGWVLIRMRRENGRLVIREANAYAAGGSGGGGGASNLNALTDVTLSGPTNGQLLTYNAATGQWVNLPSVGGLVAHALSGPYHTGLLNWGQINFAGSNLASLETRLFVDLQFAGSNLTSLETRLHANLQGMTPNDHHAQQHVLATGTALGGDHTITGASAGEVLRASGPTTAAFDVLHHTDLDTVLPDQHHPFVHDIIANVPTFGVAHTVTGADYTVVGVHPADTLAILPTSSAPGAAISILRTDASGGIQLDTNLLYVDGANNRVGVNVVPGAGLKGGAAALDIRAASTGDITQRIRQLTGQTQRLWRIEDVNGDELIVLDSVGNLQSGQPGFVSGLLGWQITPQGNAEFNNIWARGELHATVFVKDEIHASGGSLLVASAGTLFADAVINSTLVDDDVLVVYSTPAGQGVPLQVVTTSPGFVGNELHVAWVGNFLDINDPPSGPGFYFQPGDIVRSKTEVQTGVTDFWLEIQSATQYSGYARYSVLKRSGTDGTLPKGSAVVSYGKAGDGRIMLTSDLNYAPYIDIFSIGPQVWTANAGSIIPHVRLGRLDGVGLPGSHIAPGGVYTPGAGLPGITGDGTNPQYGMITGSNLSDANSGYLIASNQQFALYKINIRLNNGTNDTGLWTADGNLRIGKNIGADATTGFRVYTTDSGGHSSGDVIIGNEATGNYLRWAGGILQVSGSLIVTDPGTTVTKTYVDVQDVAYDKLAGGTYNTDGVLGGYAAVAKSDSITNADARRIIGVNGTWSSPGTNQVSWANLEIVFASPAGSKRSIAAPAAPGYITISARTYLYVDMSATGTITMKPPTTNIASVSGPNNVLIAVCDPGDPAAPAAARLASITVVAGSTFISGGNIFTGSITAGNIATDTITANKLNAASLTSTYLDPLEARAASTSQGYSDYRRIIGVSGTWTVVDGNTISWSGLSVKFAGGAARTITAQSNVTFSPNGRWYLYVDIGSGTGTMAMLAPTQSLNTVGGVSVGANHALIAVVDTGTYKASINVVAGSTYISGGNIITQSITANEMRLNTLTLDRMAAEVTDAIDGAATTGSNTAITYTNKYKLLGVRGDFTVTGQRSFSWAGVTLEYADGHPQAIPNGSVSGVGGLTAPYKRTYLYNNYGSTSFLTTLTLDELVATSVLVAVFDPGATSTDPGSISVVGGSTYISGGNIVTSSIVTGNLKAGAVTADKMFVSELNAINTQSGILTVTDEIIVGNATGKQGFIHSAGKVGYNGSVAGFYLGWDFINPAAFKFGIGDANQNLLWDGDSLSISAASCFFSDPVNGIPISLVGKGSTQVNLVADRQLAINQPVGGATETYFTPGAQNVKMGTAQANKFYQSGDTMQLSTSRTITATGSTGFKGEMCWDTNYLYLCTATNTWRRIPLTAVGSYW